QESITRSPVATVPPASLSEAQESESITRRPSAPQVAEVQRYFQQQWQPPAPLEQPLDYRLQLNQQGELERITPLNEAAKTYLDQTGMPLLGQPFVSPLSSNSLQLRLRLGVDGSVVTEQEKVE
ncbi:hypothetical protein PN462_02625, partial [Spirulina sp. CS-785/01]